MRHDEFQIGTEFSCGGRHWRCTDVGSSGITAICISDQDDDPGWFTGPLYAVTEDVFDENDMAACEEATVEVEPTGA